MTNPAREFLDFWIENSVHAAAQHGTRGPEQDVSALTRRCVEMASSLGLTRATLDQQVGDLPTYIGQKLAAANKLDRDQRD